MALPGESQGSSSALRSNFSVVRKGFDQAEVLAYLGGVEADLRALRAELAAARAHASELEANVAAWKTKAEATPPPSEVKLDEETIAAAVGEEMASVIKTTRAVAEDLRTRAQADAEALRTAAQGESEEIRQRARTEAEETLAAARSEAERIKEEAMALRLARHDEVARQLAEVTAEADRQGAELRAKYTVEAEELLARAAADAAAVRAEADRERRVTVEGAQQARERILADLARRRRIATVQIEQLRAGRERLLVSYAIVRRTLEEVSEEFQRADAEARAAAEEVGRRMASEFEADAGTIDVTGEPGEAGEAGEAGSAPAAARPGGDPASDVLARPVPGDDQPSVEEALGVSTAEGPGGQGGGDADAGGLVVEASSGDTPATGEVHGAEPPGGASPGAPPGAGEGGGRQGDWGAAAPRVQPRSAVRIIRPDGPGAGGHPEEGSSMRAGGGALAAQTGGVALLVAEEAAPDAIVVGELSVEESVTVLRGPVAGAAGAGARSTAGTRSAAGAGSGSAAGEELGAEAASAPVAEVGAEPAPSVSPAGSVPPAGSVSPARSGSPAPGMSPAGSGSPDPGVSPAGSTPPTSARPAAGKDAARSAGPADAVTGLFARIRANRAKAVAQARRTLDQVTEASPVPADAEAADRSGAAEVAVAPTDQPAGADAPGESTKPDVTGAAGGVVEAEAPPAPADHVAAAAAPAAEATVTEASASAAPAGEAPATAGLEATAATEAAPAAAEPTGADVAKPEAPAPSSSDHVGTTNPPAGAASSIAEAEASTTAPTGEGEAAALVEEADAPPESPDAQRLRRREEALQEIARELTRRLKRTVQDEQSELLDRLRGLRAPLSIDALLPAADAHLSRHASVGASHLRMAVEAGARVAADDVPFPQAVTVDVTALADGLADALVGPLRRRLEGLVHDLGEEDERESLVEAISAAYREVKTQRAETVALDSLCNAYGRGWFDAVPAGTPLRWVASDVDGACADCYDNTLAGSVPCGSPFPTDQLLPPAHEGCRCLLVVESEG